ncbi:MAG: molybdopterin-dependent oxidoreductase [Actinobacteria bacterium]|nr:molybdopterin-dependent oxidoreductase [Actinomycetota bacterium]
MAVAERYSSDLHETRSAALLGLALGVAFTICFATGLLSHLVQHPPGWFTWPSRPAGLYRVTQGLHVATGLASIPLLVAKLWVVAPAFWTTPPVRNVTHAVERAMLFPLVGGSAFLLVSGTFNTFQFYPWDFFFTRAHYGVAWITVGALVVHIAAKAALTRATVTGRLPDPDAEAQPVGRELVGRAEPTERRRFLGGVAAVSGVVTLATVGQTLRPLRAVSVLAPRDPAVGPQGLPVNKTARAARVTPELTGDDYRLRVTGRVGRPLELTLAELAALPQRTATLPIACVEGWSASGTWRGVPLRDLLELADAAPDAEVQLESLQTGGLYRRSIVSATHAADRDTLLALTLGGEPLHLDHGYPLRLIGPNRPGVMQTKWVTEVRVL